MWTDPCGGTQFTNLPSLRNQRIAVDGTHWSLTVAPITN